MLPWGREPGFVVRAMGMPGGQAVPPLDRERRLPVSTNAARPPIAPSSKQGTGNDRLVPCQTSRQDRINRDQTRLDAVNNDRGILTSAEIGRRCIPDRIGNRVDFDARSTRLTIQYTGIPARP
jgi:hypothetical protein